MDVPWAKFRKDESVSDLNDETDEIASYSSALTRIIQHKSQRVLGNIVNELLCWCLGTPG